MDSVILLMWNILFVMGTDFICKICVDISFQYSNLKSIFIYIFVLC